MQADALDKKFYTAAVVGWKRWILHVPLAPHSPRPIELVTVRRSINLKRLFKAVLDRVTIFYTSEYHGSGIADKKSNIRAIDTGGIRDEMVIDSCKG